jgi:long-subunit fatty acid transport protein
VLGLAPIPVNSSFDTRADLVWPQSIGVGIQHILSDRHRVGLDVVWYDWSHAFNRLDMQLSNPSNPLFQALAPTISDTFPLNWKDSVTVRTGYEFLYTQRDTFRLGYVYNSNTIPTGTLTPYIPALLNHTVSTGYSHAFKKVSFNFAYQYAFGDSRNVGTSQVVGGDFSHSRLDSDAHWFFFSLSRAF